MELFKIILHSDGRLPRQSKQLASRGSSALEEVDGTIVGPMERYNRCFWFTGHFVKILVLRGDSGESGRNHRRKEGSPKRVRGLKRHRSGETAGFKRGSAVDKRGVILVGLGVEREEELIAEENSSHVGPSSTESDLCSRTRD